MPDFTLEDIENELLRQISMRKLELYKPYKKQMEFHNAGKEHRERLLRAGNQNGKTLAGAAEAAMHATGLYPDDWDGRRFDKHNAGWCAGVTSEVVRDSLQRLLIGPVGSPGTGFIPQSKIVDVINARGVPNLADTILVKHVSGGASRIKLKYYEQGREKFQADTIDWVWLDEECDLDIYTEALSRTNATGGMLWMTFTPLLGMSEVVRRFLHDVSPDRADINMTIEDAEHISLEQRRKIIDSYPEHEREARINGTPILGSGRIFPVADSQVAIDPFPIPAHWPQLGALDFGWDHPTAAIRLAWDRDNDCTYVTNTHRQKAATPVIHSAALRPWGLHEDGSQWLPWMWPHDGLQHDKGSGDQLAELYRNQGLLMHYANVTFHDGSNGVEAGLMDMLDRMNTGRLKVFSHLNDWFDEFRLYHRKEGKVVKEYDDLMSATRYGIMGLRYAITKPKKEMAVPEYMYSTPTGFMG